MKRISVDLPDEIYMELMKEQFSAFQKTGKKPSLREIINKCIEDCFKAKKATQK